MDNVKLFTFLSFDNPPLAPPHPIPLQINKKFNFYFVLISLEKIWTPWKNPATSMSVSFFKIKVTPRICWNDSRNLPKKL